MADAILMSGGVGGVTSDDVTARREQVLQGYTALTADSDDEPVQGTIPDKGMGNINARPDVMDWGNSRMSIVMQEGYYHGNNGNPWVWATFADLQKLVKIAPNQVLETATYLGVKGGIKVVDTKANNYTANQAKNFGIDRSRGKLYMELGHGNAYYHRDDNSPHVEVNASVLGTAGADSVLQRQTASSQSGIKFEGTIPRWICNTGDVISADNSTIGPGLVYDDPHGRGRGIVVGIKNNAYIQGANYVFLPLPTLLAHNVREGVNIGGMVGTMKDYSTGRMVFRGATFDGTIATGVAKKGFVLNGINRYYDLRDNIRRCEGVNDGGIKMLNSYSQNTRQRSAEDIGCVLSNSINLTPFRQIKVGFVIFNFKGDGTTSQPARIELEVGVVPTSGVGGEVAQSLSDYPVRVLGGRSKYIGHTMESTSRNAGNLSDKTQKYLTLDVSDLQGQYFLYFLLGNIQHEYSEGWVHATVLINSIQVIN